MADSGVAEVFNGEIYCITNKEKWYSVRWANDEKVQE